MPAMTAGCLFCGMGGFASGFVAAGFKALWANDADPYACATFRHRFPSVPLFERDVRQLSAKELEPVDVLAAGFPCQSFSQAGERNGFEDDRGKLFFEIPRIVSEFDPQDRPRLLLMENVPHLRVGAGGEWFDTIRRELRRAGYWFRGDSCWTVNVKDATELPQSRERLFMAAASREHFPYNPFVPPASGNGSGKLLAFDKIVDRTVRGGGDAYLDPENRYYKMIDKELPKDASAESVCQLRRSYVREYSGGLFPTLTANMGGGGHNVPFVRDRWGIRRLSVDEVARLQGFDPAENIFPDIPENQQYRLLGNAVCVGLASLAGEACARSLSEDG